MTKINELQKEANLAASTLQGWFVGYTDEELVSVVRDYCQSKKVREEIILHLNNLDVGNCGVDDYELAERIEDAIYKIRFGVFWKLIRPGKYLHDREFYLKHKK